MAFNEEKRCSPKKSLKSGLETDHLIYKGLRNKITGQLRKAKANFFLEIIRQAKGNKKCYGKILIKGKESPKSGLTDLRLNGILQYDSLDVANSFNEYFNNSILELGGNPTETQFPMVLTNESIMNFKYTMMKK